MEKLHQCYITRSTYTERESAFICSAKTLFFELFFIFILVLYRKHNANELNGNIERDGESEKKNVKLQFSKVDEVQNQQRGLALDVVTHILCALFANVQVLKVNPLYFLCSAIIPLMRDFNFFFWGPFIHNILTQLVYFSCEILYIVLCYFFFLLFPVCVCVCCCQHNFFILDFP